MKRGLLAAIAALVLAAPAHAGGPSMWVGAAEDAPKTSDPVVAKAKLTLARLAGLDTVRITILWARGRTEIPAAEEAQLDALEQAARLSGIRVAVSIYPFGSSQTPLTEESRAEFAGYAAAVARAHPSFREFIVGNEPNINRFWLPQFAEDGSNAAAPAFYLLLAQTYDALKAVSPANRIWGAGLSPRGSDNPALSRHTHSPTKFIRDLGAAWRASGRTTPIMDGLAIHPYGDSSSQAPRDSAHPNSSYVGLADYAKVNALLVEAFGRELPILYDEYGVESDIPAAKTALYTGTEPTTTKPVDEAKQGEFYRQAVELAFCQPNVRGLLLFHVEDETARISWQSGMYYADGTAKASLPHVRTAAEKSRRGIVAACPDLKLTPKATLRYAGGRAFTLRCDIDCTYRVAVRVGTREVAKQSGRAIGGVAKRLAFRLPAGKRARAEATLRAPVNPGTAGRASSGWVTAPLR
jgi:hypothetical protein